MYRFRVKEAKKRRCFDVFQGKSCDFSSCNDVVFNAMKKKRKNIRKFFVSGVAWMKIFVPLHSQTTGSCADKKGRGGRERGSLKEWSKQSLKGKERRKTLSILMINPSRDRKQEESNTDLQRRVWSWLRMNASGRPNTCKSNGKSPFGGLRVAHGCVTRMQPTRCWRIARRNPD